MWWMAHLIYIEHQEKQSCKMCVDDARGTMEKNMEPPYKPYSPLIRKIT
jgi:hypothetical protein